MRLDKYWQNFNNKYNFPVLAKWFASLVNFLVFTVGLGIVAQGIPFGLQRTLFVLFVCFYTTLNTLAIWIPMRPED